MSDYIILLPVYNNVERFKKYTYKFVTKYNLKSKCLFLIQNDKDANDYKESFPDIKQQRTPKGLFQCINFMTNKLPHNKKTVVLNDDLYSLKKVSGDKLVEVSDVNNLFISIFNELKKSKLSLAGFYPMQSVSYMKDRQAVTKDLRFIQGTLYLYLNKGIKLQHNGKSDFIFTIDNYKKDGGVLRYNHIGIKYLYEATHEKDDDLNRFLKTYGDYVSKVIRHKGGTSSILLKKNP